MSVKGETKQLFILGRRAKLDSGKQSFLAVGMFLLRPQLRWGESKERDGEESPALAASQEHPHSA